MSRETSGGCRDRSGWSTKGVIECYQTYYTTQLKSSKPVQLAPGAAEAFGAEGAGAPHGSDDEGAAACCGALENDSQLGEGAAA